MYWDSSLECGISVIDQEHRELISRLQQLTHEPSPSVARSMLDFLSDYVVKHFAHEQVMHRQNEYPEADAHKEAHKDFVGRFLALEKKYDGEGGSPEMLREIVEFVGEWLRAHILGMDRDFSEYYRERKKLGLPQAAF